MLKQNSVNDAFMNFLIDVLHSCVTIIFQFSLFSLYYNAFFE